MSTQQGMAGSNGAAPAAGGADPRDGIPVQGVAEGPRASVVPVDPGTAARWLERNGANRRVRPVQVAKFAADMAEGRWALTGAAIQFAADGRLLDGQHRLQAIVASGVTVQLFVVRGLEAEAQAFIDTGAKRSLADQLTIAGYPHHTVLAAGARLAFAWLTGRLHEPRGALSDAEIREFLEAHPCLVDAAALAAGMRSNGLDAHPSAMCAAVWMLLEEGHTRADVVEFFASMAENCTSGIGDPRNALLHRIGNARRARERIEQPVMLALLIRAYNAHYRGKTVRRLPVHRKGEPIEIPAVAKPTAAPVPHESGSLAWPSGGGS